MPAPKTAYVLDAGSTHISLEMPKNPPRLAVALLWAKSGQYEAWQTDLEKEILKDPKKIVDLEAATTREAFEVELGRLLKHIQQRLEIGVTEAWISKYAYNAPSPPKEEGKTRAEYAAELQAAWNRAFALQALYDEPEEQWARIFSEMFVYMPYAGNGQTMFSNGNENHLIFEAWPKVYCTVAACQHLCSYTPLTRGSKPDKIGNGMNASANAGLPIFGPIVKDAEDVKDAEGKNKRAAWVTTSVTTYEKRDLRPGDLVAGKDADPNQKGFAHAASILRRWPLGAAAKAETGANLQVIDTGVFASVGDSSTQDHGWLTAAAMSSAFGKAVANESGFGRLPEAADLKGAVETTKKALPMGFARLVLAAPGGRARYVSAMLPMWHGEHRFTIARYLWSLRDLPAKNLVGYWALYAAQGHTMLDELVKEAGAPGRSCEQIIAAAKKAREGRKPPGKAPALLRTSACSSKPRVVRFVTKSTQSWKEVAPNEEGLTMTYEEGPEADALREKWKKDADAKKAKHGNAPTEVTTVKGANSGMPLELAARPAQDKTDHARPGGWAFLEDKDFLSTELLLPDATKPDEVVERSMGQNSVEYFKGGSGAAPAGGGDGEGGEEAAKDEDSPYEVSSAEGADAEEAETADA